MDLLDELINSKSQGENYCALENKYIMYLQWIRILEDYLAQNFDSNGTITDPDVVCLTADQINALIAKMDVVRGGNRYTQDDWLLVTAFWNDLGFWRDSSFFNDQVPIV